MSLQPASSDDPSARPPSRDHVNPPSVTRRAALLVLVVGLTVASVAFATRGSAAPALREVSKDRPHTLRVLHLIDPRLPTLTAAQRTELHALVERRLKDWFGYRVTLREVGVRDLAEAFAARAEVFERYPAIVSGDFDPTTSQGRVVLRDVVTRAFAGQPLPRLAEQLGSEPFASHAAAIDFACERFLTRLGEIQSIPLDPHRSAATAPNAPASSTAPTLTLVDPARRQLHGFNHWCAFDYELSEADLVFTNTLVVGADRKMPINVIVRGGVTLGITNANRHNGFGATAMVCLFPFLSDAPFWLRERGPLPDAERLDVIATLTLHELGHFFLRAAHPGHAPCIHEPAPNHRYRDWHAAIVKHGPCRLDHPRLASY